MRKGEYPEILKLSAVTYGEYNQQENKALLYEDMFLKNRKDDLNKIYLWKLIKHQIFKRRIQNLANGQLSQCQIITFRFLLYTCFQYQTIEEYQVFRRKNSDNFLKTCFSMFLRFHAF